MSFKASFSARSLTTRISCPGSPSLCDDSGSDSPPQVRAPPRYRMSITEACSAVYSPRAAATGFAAPWGFPPPRRLPRRPPHLHGRILKALGIPKGKYDSLKALFGARSLTTRGSFPGSPRPCDDSGSDSPIYVRYIDTAYASLKPVVQSTVHVQLR